MSTTENKSLLKNAGEWFRQNQFLIAVLFIFSFLFYLTDSISDKIVAADQVQKENILLKKVVADQGDLIYIQKKFSVEQKKVIELQKLIINRYNKTLRELKEFIDPPEYIDPDKIT